MKAVLTRYNLDAIIYPTQTTRINKIGEYAKQNQRGLFGNFGTSLASLAGWPELTVDRFIY
jgi:amidase